MWVTAKSLINVYDSTKVEQPVVKLLLRARKQIDQNLFFILKAYCEFELPREISLAAVDVQITYSNVEQLMKYKSLALLFTWLRRKIPFNDLGLEVNSKGVLFGAADPKLTFSNCNELARTLFRAATKVCRIICYRELWIRTICIRFNLIEVDVLPLEDRQRVWDVHLFINFNNCLL